MSDRKFFLALLLLLQARGYAQQAAGNSGRPLPARSSTSPALGDASLTKRVEVERIGGPLQEYLEELSDVIGVSHRVDAPFDRRPVVTIDIDMPLARAHRILARTYSLSWEVSLSPRPSYTLREAKGDRERRTKALLSARRQGRERLGARWNEVRQLALLSKEQLAARAKAGERMAQTLQHPRASSMAQLVFRLPASEINQLMQRGSTTVPIASLPPQLRNLAVGAVGNTRMTLGTSDGQRHVIHSEDIRNGSLILSMGGTPDRPTVWGSLRYPNTVSGGTDVNLLDVVALHRQPPSERRKQVSSKAPGANSHPILKKRITLRDPIPRRKTEPGERPGNAKPLAFFLKQIAEQTGLPVVAECDYRARDPKWLNNQWWLDAEIKSKPLYEALDLLCADFEYEWEHYEGALVFRPRLWCVEPADREYVIPSRSARPTPR